MGLKFVSGRVVVQKVERPKTWEKAVEEGKQEKGKGKKEKKKDPFSDGASLMSNMERGIHREGSESEGLGEDSAGPRPGYPSDLGGEFKLGNPLFASKQACVLLCLAWFSVS